MSAIDAPAHAPAQGGRWPVWKGAPGDVKLARYVSFAVLGAASLPEVGAHLRQGVDPQQGDRRVAADRYDLIAAKGLHYQTEPLSFGEGQQIRDGHWMLRRKVATCLDLAVLYATLCFDGKVSPLLAVDPDHVFVLLRLGALEADLGPSLSQPPGTQDQENGSYTVTDANALVKAVRDGAFLAVECTLMTVDKMASFQQACATAEGLLYDGLVLVDVAGAQWHHGVEQLPAPSRQRVTRFMPSSGQPLELFRGQQELVDKLSGRAGLGAVVAPSGYGKSVLARAVAERNETGAAWFLDASDRKTLIASLAAASFNESGRSFERQTALSLEEFAEAALAVLHDSDEAWTVILDNADVSPNDLHQYIPRANPEHGQLVLATTTTPAWQTYPNLVSEPLAEVPPDDVISALGAEFVEPVGGRPLMVEAFRRYLAAGGAPDLVGVLEEDPKETRGPRALYRAVLSWAGESSPLREAAEIAAAFPADHLPRDLLSELVPGGADDVGRLIDIGLVSQGPTMRMHRLLGAAVRDVGGKHAARAGLALIEPRALRVLDRHADVDTIKRFAAALGAADESATVVDHGLGLRLVDGAAVLETKGHTALSSDLYERATRYLDEETLEDLEPLAMCWLGMARRAYQQYQPTRRKPGDEAGLRAARELALKAEAAKTKFSGADSAGRHVAMRGLIDKVLATFVKGPAGVAALRDALDTLVEADRRRNLPPADAHDEAELLRSTYNLAGIRIDLAKRVEVAEAVELLTTADKIYEQVAEGRHKVYDMSVHPHIAACIHGRGIVSYYQAILLEGDPLDRLRSLRNATHYVHRALSHRETLGGEVETDDVAKGTALLAKIALARQALPRATVSEWMALVVESLQELNDGDLVGS